MLKDASKSQKIGKKKQAKDQVSSVCQNKASYPVVFGVSGVSGSGWVKPIPA